MFEKTTNKSVRYAIADVFTQSGRYTRIGRLRDRKGKNEIEYKGYGIRHIGLSMSDM